MNQLIFDAKEFLALSRYNRSELLKRILQFRELGYLIVVTVPEIAQDMEKDSYFECLTSLFEERQSFDQLCIAGSSEWEHYLYLDDKGVTLAELIADEPLQVLTSVGLK